MSKFVQKSFSSGILSPNVISRVNLQGYDSAARNLENVLVGRLGEAYRRGGTSLVSVQDTPISRIVPFYLADRTFVIAFSEGRITSSSSSSRVNTSAIKIFDITDHEIDSLDLNSTPSSNSVFPDPILCQVYGSNAQEDLSIYDSYSIDVRDGFRDSELRTMDYSQLGNTIIFSNSTFPPFLIRHEGENRFVFYRNFLELVANGGSRGLSLSNKAIFSLPYSYYGFGIRNVRVSERASDNTYYFEATLAPKDNFDSSVLSEDNFRLWRNRAFVVSSQTNTTEAVVPTDANSAREFFRDNIGVFGGVIYSVKESVREENFFPGSRLGYTITGEISANSLSVLDDIDVSNTVLFLCDWSERLGFPQDVTVFENRVCFAGSEAFPSKLWFSAIPGFRKVQIGTERLASSATAVQNQFTIDRPVYDYIFRDQLTLFDNEAEALGLTLSDTGAPGSLFINDNLGFAIKWIHAGEVLYIGTNQGIFISLGTDGSASSVTPFNRGFVKTVETPVKVIRPELINRVLYFVGEDNTVRSLTYNSQSGYDTASVDELFRGLDADEKEIVTFNRNSILRDFTIGRPAEEVADDTQVVESGVLVGETTLALPRAGETASTNTVVPFTSFLLDPNAIVAEYIVSRASSGEQSDLDRSIFNYSDAIRIIASSAVRDSTINEFFEDRRGDLPLNSFTNYSQDFLIQNLLLSFTISATSSTSTTADRSARIYMQVLVRRGGAFIPDSITFNSNSVNGSQMDSTRMSTLFDSVPPPNGVDFETIHSTTTTGSMDNGYIVEGASLNGPRISRILVNDPNFSRSWALTLETLGALSQVATLTYTRGSNTLNLAVADATVRNVNQFTQYEYSLDSSARQTLENIVIGDGDNPSYTLIFRNASEEVISEKTLSSQFHFATRSYLVSDDTSSPASGTYDVRYAVFDLNTLDNAAYNNSDRFQELLSYAIDVTTGENATNPLVFTPTTWNVSIRGVTDSSQPMDTVPEGDISEITTTTETLPLRVDVPQSLMAYDWTKRTLFLFTSDQTYLAYCLNPEAGVNAWSRGTTAFRSPIYIRNLTFKPPVQHPSLFGLDTDGRLLMLTNGLNRGTQSYFRELPNCLDQHLIFEIPAATTERSIDLAVFKDWLLSYGFKNEDIITLATPLSTLLDKVTVGSLTGSLSLSSEQTSFIVGKPFVSEISAFVPVVQDNKTGQLAYGSKYSFGRITIHAIFDTDLFINGSLHKAEAPENHYKYERYGTFFYQNIVKSSTSYDPLIEVEITSPKPFALGGYVVEVKIGGNK